MMEPEEYFKRRAINNESLREAIPEFLGVIEDLRAIRNNDWETRDYIENWLNSKVKKTVWRKDSNGKLVECDDLNPDMHLSDFYAEWLLEYFLKLQKECTGGLTGYEYALTILIQYHNRKLLNKRGFGFEINIPYFNEDDLLDYLDREGNRIKKELSSNIEVDEEENTGKEEIEHNREYSKVKKERIINEDGLRAYFKSTFKGAGNGNLNYFNTMIEELRTDRAAKEFAQIALMAYEGDNMNDRKPKTFNEWYTLFCNYIGCEKKTYQPKDLKTPRDDLKRIFSYL